MNTVKSDITPLLDPLIAIFKSRKFVLALCGLIADLVVMAVPTAAAYREQLVGLITTFILGWMGMTTIEDVNKVHSAAKVAVAAHAASATIAAAQIVANKATPPISSPEGADGDTRPMPPVKSTPF